MTAPLAVLDAAAARRWASAAAGALEATRAQIDTLNVYPVPDGDTGTNLHLTVVQGLAEVQAVDDGASLGEVSAAYARGCLLGARGNSGIIVAQLLHGWAEELAGHDEAGPDVVRRALRRADAEAWVAVADPVEGTILSVTRAAADAAAGSAGTLDELVTEVVDAARAALARTPEQLPVLAAAGVVDAGGAGLLVLLEALQDVVAGRPGRPGELPAPAVVVPAGSAASQAAQGCARARDDDDDDDDDSFGSEVMYLLEADDAAIPALRQRLRSLGDSLVVVGGHGLWNVHVHTDDPGAAVEVGIDAGRPRQVRITHLAEQVRRTAGVAARSPARPRALTVVAFAAGPGLAGAFEQAGALAVRPAAGHRVSTAEVLEAVRAAGARTVVVLPNDPDTLAVAQAAAEQARAQGVQAVVLPTRTQVQGLAAVAVHDPGRDPEEDVLAMSAAAAGTRHGAVTVAAREAITSAGRCRPGDVLGVVEGDFALIGEDLVAVAVDVLRRLLFGGGELVTLVTGDGAPDDLVPAVRGAVCADRPDVEVQVVDGGQQRYPLLVGVE